MAMDIGSLTALVGSLKTAGEITKAMINLRDATTVQSKVIELQGIIMTAQSSALTAQTDQFSLLERIRQLEETVADFETWDTEKNRYQLTDYGGGTFAYELKEIEQGGEPPHRICAACYQNGHKSILQFKFTTVNHQDKYVCAGCSTEFLFGHRQEAQIRTRRSRSPFNEF